MKLPILIFLSTFIFLSCAKKAEELLDSVTTSDGSQTAAQLAGSGIVCETFPGGSGTSLSGKVYSRFLTLQANGTYAYSVYFSDAAACANSQVTGGNNIATYIQGGTWSVGGIASSPSTATKITFTPLTIQMTVRPGTYVGNAQAGAMRDWLNTCVPSPGFTVGAVDSTKSIDGITCGTNGGTHVFANPPFLSSTYSNIGYNPGDGTFSAGARDDIWSPGSLGTTFPGSYTETWNPWF